MFSLFAGLAGLVLLITLADPLQGATYYARPGGPDHSCAAATNEATPRPSATAGAECLSPGDTLILLDGTYAEALIDLLPSGTERAYTTLKSRTPRGARLVGHQPGSGNMLQIGTATSGPRAYIQVEGLSLDGGGTVASMNHVSLYPTSGCQVPPADDSQCSHHINIWDNDLFNTPASNSLSGNAAIGSGGGQHHLWIKGNHIHHIGQGASAGDSAFDYGMYLSNSRDHTIEDNELDHISGWAIHNYCSAGVCNDITLRGNYIHDNGGGVLLMCGGARGQVYNNIVARSGLWDNQIRGGLVFGTSCSGNPTSNHHIYNNTSVYNRGSSAQPGCLTLSGSSGVTASSIVVRNNLCWGNTPDDSIGNTSSGQASNTLDHNLCSGVAGTGSCADLPYGDPHFVQAIPNTDLSAAGVTRDSFQLQASSPARDVGVSTASGTPTFVTDIGGAPRQVGVQDVGAWEYAAPPLPLPAGLYLHWPFDEKSGDVAADATAFGHPGTLIGTPPPQHTIGRGGYVWLAFSGAGEHVRTQTLVWPAAQDVTLVFWVYTEGGAQGGPALGAPSATPNLFGACVPCADNRLWWQYGSFDTGGTGSMSLDFRPYLRQWTHVALAANGQGTLGRIWVNGQMVGTSTTFGAPTEPLQGFEVGRWDKSRSLMHGPGSFDDIRLYSLVLTDAEVQQLYQETASRMRRILE